MRSALAPDKFVTGVLAEDIPTVWAWVESYIGMALEYADGKLSKQDVFDALLNRDMQLWVVPGGVWVTQIVTYPQSKRADLLLAAGAWEDWLEHFEVVKDWAREQGCNAIEITGRPGWGRRTGFEEIHRTLRVWL